MGNIRHTKHTTIHTHAISVKKTRVLFLFVADFRGSTPDNALGLRPLSPEKGDTPMPLPELDPETLRCGLRDFLQELRDAQRDRVTARRRARRRAQPDK